MLFCCLNRLHSCSFCLEVVMIFNGLPQFVSGVQYCTLKGGNFSWQLYYCNDTKQWKNKNDMWVIQWKICSFVLYTSIQWWKTKKKVIFYVLILDLKCPLNAIVNFFLTTDCFSVYDHFHIPSLNEDCACFSDCGSKIPNHLRGSCWAFCTCLWVIVAFLLSSSWVVSFFDLFLLLIPREPNHLINGIHLWYTFLKETFGI